MQATDTNDAAIACDAGQGFYLLSIPENRFDRHLVALVDGPGAERPFVRALRTSLEIPHTEAAAIHAHAVGAPTATLVVGVRFASAAALVRALQAVSVRASMRPSPIDTPMVCRPRLERPEHRDRSTR